MTRAGSRDLRGALILVALAFSACSDGNITTGNSRPTATILAPLDGAVLPEGEPVELIGVVGDRGSATLDLRVTWTSSRDGLLVDGPPDDDAGNTRFAWNGPSPGAHDLTLAVVDPNGVSASATVRLTIDDPPVNTAPSAPGVTVTPLEPTQAADLLCAVSTPSTDAEGDAVTYAFAWQRDGLPTGLVSETLPWAETEVGDLWTCAVTPFDGTDNGSPGSATVTVSAGCASLLLDSSNPGAVTVPDDPALRLSGGDFTVEAWVRLDAVGLGATSTVVSKRGPSAGEGWHFGVGGSSSPGRLQFLLSDPAGDSVIGVSPVPLGGWHHVAATFDAGSGLLTLWLDGANVGSGTVGGPSGGTLVDLVLGADPTHGGLGWDGGLDDVRISGTRRYTTTFVPPSLLGADADTVAWWGFEEAGGMTSKDLSGGGHDGLLSGGATFDLLDSTCTLDQAPTAPVVAVTPEYPLLTEPLSCTLVTPAVDAEGATVTYSGLWLRDGVPTGQSFTAFPGSLSAATALGEQWTCSVTASDGGQSGPAGTDSVWTGALPLGALVVNDPGAAAATSLTFTPPLPGLLRATMSNPDASRDGAFVIDVLGYGSFWLFTGQRGWAYGGSVVLGEASTDLEFNLSPSMGTLTLDLSYLVAGGPDGVGVDTLDLLFVYGEQLSSAGATLVLESDVGPTATNAAQATVTFGAGERLLVETAACGFGGGGHGLYTDRDGVSGNDGLARIETGFAGNCLIPLQSRPIGAGTVNLTLVNEDDYFFDNTGQRAVQVHRYTP